LPGDTGSIATAINNNGQIVGLSVGANGAENDATLWSGGTITNLGSLPGSNGSNSIARGINDAGQIVGQCVNPNTNTWDATLWSHGSIIDLNSVVGASGWQLADATAINDQGQIAGYGINPSGQYDAFLLTPSAPLPFGNDRRSDDNFGGAG
jgi:probable HAF family extracellular repeat protein